MIEWGTPGKASVLVGGQFGSEGKGLAAAWLAMQPERIDLGTTNAGAQAGHTTRSKNGKGFVTFHLPTSSVIRQCPAYINAGSIIDWATLRQELDDCGLNQSMVSIHPRAAVITRANQMEEQNLPTSSVARVGGTLKGVGAALSDKIMRRSPLAEGTAPDWAKIEIRDLNKELRHGRSIILEVPQGTDLSINHGLEPRYTTSRDCWVGSGLSDAGIHPSFIGPIAMVVRSMPIRVGSVYDEHGNLIGHSGSFYRDSKELDWDRDLPGVTPELTTVTRRKRRIASFSYLQYEHAICLNRPDIIILSFLNYLANADAFTHLVDKIRWEELRHGWSYGKMQHCYSFSPFTEEVTTSLDAAVSWYDQRRVTW